MRSGVVLIVAVWTAICSAGEPDRRTMARPVVDRAIEFLRTTQSDDGTWGVDRSDPSAFELPAITGLALHGMLLDRRIDADDPSASAAIAAILSYRQPDGGIYGTAGPDGPPILPGYNTSICVSALSLVRTPEASAAVVAGVERVKLLQWGPPPENGSERFHESVDANHPFYGGWGYGRNGRPDISNTQFALQALHDAGVSSEDPAVKRGLDFLRRLQMDPEINDEAYARETAQGGFIYATTPDGESVDGRPGQSQAGEFTETLPDGRRVVSLRAYGSVSYAGLKSLIHADLSPMDPRVVSVQRWLSQNYTLDENPGLGQQGFYYYLLAMARALDAAGEDELEVVDPDGSIRVVRWREDLIARLASLQQADGGFEVLHPRWMEDNRELTTAYALIALQIAAR